MIPTDAELVAEAARTYVRDDPIASTPDGALRAFLTILATGVAVVSYEGTHNKPGWILDFDAAAAGSSAANLLRLFCATANQHPTIQHPRLGLLHAGFDAGAMALFPTIAGAVAGRPFAITGHSLGAAEALRTAAEFVLAGTPPLKVAAFAPPRVGGKEFVDSLSSLPHPCWKWGDDPIPEVPFTLPSFPYEQFPLIKVGHPLLDAFECHDVSNYVSVVGSETTES